MNEPEFLTRLREIRDELRVIRKLIEKPVAPAVIQTELATPVLEPNLAGLITCPACIAGRVHAPEDWKNHPAHGTGRS